MVVRPPNRRATALREQPRAVDLHERVEIAERRDHQTSLAAVDRDVMRQAVRFAGRSFVRQREDRALPDEVRRRIVLVQVCEHRSKRLARPQIHARRWILGVHVDHEVCVRRKERHLAFRVAAIGAVCVRFDEFANREAVRGFSGRDAVVLHDRGWLSLRASLRYLDKYV